MFKLEVIAGPGLVTRTDDLMAWAAPNASSGLQEYLATEVRSLARRNAAGDVLARQLASILERGDPEPRSAFAVVGRAEHGLVVLLHGPVQLWDGAKWTYPPVSPGWQVVSVARAWPLIILPYGAPPPPPSHKNPLNLISGTVPGGGIVLLESQQRQLPSASSTASASTAHAAPVHAGPTNTYPAQAAAAPSTTVESGSSSAGASQTATPEVPSQPAIPQTESPASTQVPEAAHTTQPSALVADDASVWYLEDGYLIGSHPTADPGVSSGRFHALTLKPARMHEMAPVHVEVTKSGADLRVKDRGAGPTYVRSPSGASWEMLNALEERVITDGWHLSCGGRVLTFVDKRKS